MKQKVTIQVAWMALVWGFILLTAARPTPAAPFPGTLAWQMQAPIPGGIEGAAGGVIGSKLYVSHGLRSAGDSADLSIFDIPTDTWTPGPVATVPRAEMAGGVADGKLYAIGGRTPTAVVEAFDPVTNTWTTVASLSMPRGGLGAASVGGLIYAVGGREGPSFGIGPIVGTNEVYDPVTNAWTMLAPMPRPLSDVYATVGFGGKVYVLGGADGPASVTGMVQIFDPATNSWSVGAPMPTPRAAAMAGVVCGQIVVFGGYDGVSNLDVTEIYDPVSDSWAPGPAMLIPASEIAQGPTQTVNVIFAVGSGIFGVHDDVVQALVAQCTCPECTASDQCHVAGTCDATTGKCTNPTAPDGATCSDENGCTVNDTCRDGVCVSGSPKVCTASDQCHLAGSCDVTTGLCTNPIAPDGTTCGVGGNCVKGVCNAPPDCTTAVVSPSELWPPNHKFVNVSVTGVTDPDGDPVAITITGITQDEPLNGLGDGDTCPDANGVGSATASLRAERSGTGDGRVYHVSFVGGDGRGGRCVGTATVCVPHDQRPGHTCGDQGPLVNSTGPCS